MHGVVVTDDHSTPLRPAILWADRRAELVLHRWRALPRQDRAALANPVVAGMAGPILDWLSTQGQRPEGFRLRSPKDWLRAQLTGDHVTERSDASATLLWDVVRDDWSGESRDPVTLSGGETFVVSLALALGLADVIAHEAGGSELDTLFVDEGFGTLDADTLDDVMDTLDSLRDGGRVVGVVSHVAELRDRIPTQLQVRKHRAGSTVHQVGVG